jgi:hypothetical protein
MGKKKYLKEFRRLAGGLPVVMQHTVERHIVTGRELLEQDLKEADGAPIDPLKQYIQRLPVDMAVNHKRRMANAYKRHGIAGVKAYIAAVEKEAERQKTIIAK